MEGGVSGDVGQYYSNAFEKVAGGRGLAANMEFKFFRGLGEESEACKKGA